MKKVSVITLFLLAVLCVSLLCACGSKEPDMKTVGTAVYNAIGDEQMANLPDGYVEDVMGIALDGYASRNAMANINNGNEYGIFCGKDASQTEELRAALEAYLVYRLDNDDSTSIKNAEVWTSGSYVMYAIVGNDIRPAVKDAFTSCFEG